MEELTLDTYLIYAKHQTLCLQFLALILYERELLFGTSTGQYPEGILSVQAQAGA